MTTVCVVTAVCVVMAVCVVAVGRKLSAVGGGMEGRRARQEGRHQGRTFGGPRGSA